MSFIELAKNRFSVRSYKKDEVSQEVIDQILEAGRIAPTAANKQPQRILVVKSKGALEKLTQATRIYDAPLAFIICGDVNNVWVRPQDGKKTIDIDASIVTDHMMHRASELGLGTLWITWFTPEIIRKDFNIPDNFIPVNILLVGFSDGDKKSPDRYKSERKPISETVFYETF